MHAAKIQGKVVVIAMSVAEVMCVSLHLQERGKYAAFLHLHHRVKIHEVDHAVLLIPAARQMPQMHDGVAPLVNALLLPQKNRLTVRMWDQTLLA